MTWPPVEAFDPAKTCPLLMDVGDLPSSTIHAHLALLYPYWFGYRNSPLYQSSDESTEIQLHGVRIKLEQRLLNMEPLSLVSVVNGPHDQRSLARRLRLLVESNRGVSHPFFDYCAADAGLSEMRKVAMNEVCRNEIVDDEVAMMLPGLSGLIKNAIALNLADEMGHGIIRNQHSYWLRQQLSDNDEVETGSFLKYRRTRAWYLNIPSNVFNALLLRPGYRWAAFGYFLITESWVAPHFEKLIQGFERVGYSRQLKYFTAHEKLDRLHGEELLEALDYQLPKLTEREVTLIEWGAGLAIEAGVQYFDHFLAELRAVEVPGDE
jgi:hypothetical protein